MVANDSATNTHNSYTLESPSTPPPINPLDSPANLIPSDPYTNGTTTPAVALTPAPLQVPIAVVSLACRLPGHNPNPSSLWEFLKNGGIASNTPPESRFNLDGHYDGSLKPNTMRSPGGMFLEDVDPRDLDAGFFGTTTVDAVAMDPQQRQLLEVVYECLENGGLGLERIKGRKVGVLVGSYAVDFGDMQARDPEDRAESITIGIGRAILSNRISHFLDIKGPSMTIDTACSGSLVSVDVACQYLNTQQADGMIVAGANMYLSPDHNMDMGAMRGASSATGKCHTFDAKADGYIKGEAVNAVYLKRLDDAIRDGDPVRAVIRGSATNSDGWTPGIASPSSDAQAAAIRTAYSNAGIANFNETGYLECHGTGTLAGDPIEVAGAASVFSPTRAPGSPLIIGSIKSNIGHSEPAAGISGLIKAVLAVENGTIPGNPTFIDPNPKIEFEKLRVKATRPTIRWPQGYGFRRASVNSFGYGGSNAHVVVDEVTNLVPSSKLRHVSSFAQEDGVEDFFDLSDDEPAAISARPKIIVASANDEDSLKTQIDALSRHLLNPAVKIKLHDLAYTLSERRTRHYRRGFAITSKTADVAKENFVFGKKKTDAPRVGFIFTGQGAQWPQMGRDLIANFPTARRVLDRLDKALQSLPVPPKWSLISELAEPRSPEHLRLPEFSQPLVTALQLATLAVLKSWGVEAQSVVGHSSGEIAAAAAAGLLSEEDSIKVAYLRGLAAKNQAPSNTAVGMLAVGVGAETAQQYIDFEDPVEVACYNSPSSVTLSGTVSALEKTRDRLQKDGHFARLLQVNLAYHSTHMAEIGEHYETLLLESINWRIQAPSKDAPVLFSSMTGNQLDIPVDATYWKTNMVSPVRFSQATTGLLSGKAGADFLIEIGPSNALIGPTSQIKKVLPGEGVDITYTSTAKRGPATLLSLYDVAGRLFIAGGTIDLAQVNKEEERPSVIVDLPNYAWNHSKKYWQESEASKDWRFRKFVHHDLLGTKVLSSPWQSPTWKKTLRLADVPWLKDHKMGHEIIFPGAGYVAMAVEAVYQAAFATNWEGRVPEKYRFKLRDLKFPRALVLEEKAEQRINLVLTPLSRSSKSWFEYKVSSLTEQGAWVENSTGFIRIETEFADIVAPENALRPLEYPTPGRLWYKAMQDAGYNFGKDFQQHLEVESTVGQLANRSLVSLQPPPSTWKQSHYPIHPANMDGAFQSVAPSLWRGDRSSIDAVLVPAVVDSIIIYPHHQDTGGISVATSEYLGVGRKESKKNYSSSCQVFSPNDGALLFELKGLRYHQLQTRGDVYTSHPYARLEWKPDITLLDEEQLQLVLSSSEDKLQETIDLIAHKFPTLKVAEINLDEADESTLWFSEETTIQTRAAYTGYHFFTNSPTAVINLQDRHGGNANSSFTLADFTRPEVSLPEQDFDFVIVKANSHQSDIFDIVARHVAGLLSSRGFALFVKVVAPREEAFTESWLRASGFESIRQLAPGSESYLAQRSPLVLANAIANRTIHVVNIAPEGPSAAAARDALEKRGWSFTSHGDFSTDSLPSHSNVLLLNELDSSVLEATTPEQWQILQAVIRNQNNLLWVTQGGQLQVTNPTSAAAQGFLRVIRAEEPLLRLLTLDVASSSRATTHSAIDTALRLLMVTNDPKPIQHETEYVERDSVIHISRIRPDEGLNTAKVEDSTSGGGGRLSRQVSLHESEHTIRFRAEQLGNIDSLAYSEVSTGEITLPPNTVEVELYAAGLNFKDVAVTMGIVPENEHLLGLEGAGIVRRVASDVTRFQVGQRVVVFEKGTFANRIIATTERTFALPDDMTFEEASTLPAVYLTSIYSLFHLGGLDKGRRKKVLIHSASGGVGIASIQLAKYAGAEIFVTVGTQEKRDFLKNSFGVTAPMR